MKFEFKLSFPDMAPDSFYFAVFDSSSGRYLLYCGLGSIDDSRFICEYSSLYSAIAAVYSDWYSVPDFNFH